MNIELIATALLSEIEELEESLQIIAARVKKSVAIGSHANVDVSKINNLIGKYQVLMELMANEATEATEVTEPTKR